MVEITESPGWTRNARIGTDGRDRRLKIEVNGVKFVVVVYTPMEVVMKMIRFVSIVLLILSVVGCAGRRVSGLPGFVVSPPSSDDTFYGVGYGRQSTFQLSKTVAMTNARADVARQVETLIEAAVIVYAQESGEGNNTQALEFVESVTREITNAKLAGAIPERFEQDNEGGVWVLVSYPKSNLRDSAAELFVRNEAAAFAEFKAEEALEMLDRQLEKIQTKSEPVR